MSERMGANVPRELSVRDAGKSGADASGSRSVRRVLPRLNTRRRWGYWVWIIAAAVILIPELIAAFDAGALPFTTISKMTGHLERRFDLLELLVVALLVWVAYSSVRVPPRTRSGVAKGEDDVRPVRTSGGRLTMHAPEPRRTDLFDAEEAPTVFWFVVVVALALIAAAGFAASTWWSDSKPHYHVGYVIYSLLGLLWVVVPSVLAFAFGKDVPFPTFFRTVTNLEAWLASRKWKYALGPSLAWLISYLILTGLVILLLHLTLYPFPNITKILNPNG